MKRAWKDVVCLRLVNLIVFSVSSSPLLAQNKSQDTVEKQAAPLNPKVADTAPDLSVGCPAVQLCAQR
jgi:hypothetical protein